MAQTIVIAWAEMTGLRPIAGKFVRFDGYNSRPAMEPCLEAKAAVWLLEGTDEDLAKARAYADAMGVSRVAVYTFETSEEDPLGLARQRILAETPKRRDQE